MEVHEVDVAKGVIMQPSTDADRFIERLKQYSTQESRENFERLLKSGDDDMIMGVRPGHVFALAKEFIDMPTEQISLLLESPVHEIRMGALSIMDKQARRKKTPESRRKELFDLYISHSANINNWDLVDLGCQYVVGGYLFDKPRGILHGLAGSRDTWERRTAIVSTLYFIRQGDVEDTFAIAEMLLGDKEDLMHKATGGLLREAGKKDLNKLVSFLDKHAVTMPRVMLRYAIEHMDKEQRDYYVGMKKAK
jgi:3-methyladenine DNA glycosylase AlkD